MTSPLAKIKSNPQESKRLIGIKYEDFLKLLVFRLRKDKTTQQC